MVEILGVYIGCHLLRHSRHAKVGLGWIGCQGGDAGLGCVQGRGDLAHMMMEMAVFESC